MSSTVRILLSAILPAAVLAGCATVPGKVSESTKVAPEPLKLSIGYDAALLRVDLKRATHLVLHFKKERDRKGTRRVRPEPIEVKNAYGLLIVDFGNGLILDQNGNLGIDLLRLYDLNRAASFHVVEQFNGLFRSGRSVSKSGGRLTRKGVGLTVERLSARTEGNIVHLSGEHFFPHMRIVRGNQSLSLEPAGRRTAGTITIRQPKPDMVLFPETGGTMTVRRFGANRIQSSGGLDIVRKVNDLSIVIHAPGGVVASFDYSKTRNGCVVTSSDGYPAIRIARIGKVIYVTSDRYLAATLTILEERTGEASREESSPPVPR